MADLSHKVRTKLNTDRATQEAAQPTQKLDSTTIFTKLIPGWRNAATDKRDLNTIINGAL